MSRDRNIVRGDVKNPLYRVLKFEISSVDRFLVEAIINLCEKYGVDDYLIEKFWDITIEADIHGSDKGLTYSLVGILDFFVDTRCKGKEDEWIIRPLVRVINEFENEKLGVEVF